MFTTIMIALLMWLSMIRSGVAQVAFSDVVASNVDGFIGSAAVAGRAGSCSGGSAASATTEAACTGGGGSWTAAVSGSGATGIYELGSVVPMGLAVCIVIALSFAGYHLVRRLFMRGQRA